MKNIFPSNGGGEPAFGDGVFSAIEHLWLKSREVLRLRLDVASVGKGNG
jgi:hypothetical protein